MYTAFDWFKIISSLLRSLAPGLQLQIVLIFAEDNCVINNPSIECFYFARLSSSSSLSIIVSNHLFYDECEIDPDLLSIESSVSGSHLRNIPIVCSYIAKINACAGAALIAVIPHPRYNPETPSRL